jgi:hypothetical protein
MVSAKGFQSGAYDVVTKTNIQLLSWAEFEASFRTEWTQNWVNRVSRAGVELRSFVNYLIDLSLQNVDISSLINSKWPQMEEIRTGHEDWLFMSMKDNYIHFNTAEFSWEEVQNTIENRAPRYLSMKPEYLRDYFNAIFERCREEIAKMEALFEGAVKWDPITMLPY